MNNNNMIYLSTIIYICIYILNNIRDIKIIIIIIIRMDRKYLIMIKSKINIKIMFLYLLKMIIFHLIIKIMNRAKKTKIKENKRE